MPFSDSQQHLQDILDSVKFIEEFVEGIDFEAYRGSELRKSAVERKIQILTEAVIRLEVEGLKHSLKSTGQRTAGSGISCGIPTTASTTRSCGTQ